MSTITSQQGDTISNAGELKNSIERRDIIEEVRRRKYDFEQVEGKKADIYDIGDILSGTDLTYDEQTNTITKNNSNMDPIDLNEIGEFNLPK